MGKQQACTRSLIYHERRVLSANDLFTVFMLSKSMPVFFLNVHKEATLCLISSQLVSLNYPKTVSLRCCRPKVRWSTLDKLCGKIKYFPYTAFDTEFRKEINKIKNSEFWF